MTGKVIKSFRDKKTDQVFEIGDKYSAGNIRINELVKNGFIAKSTSLKGDA